MAVHDDLTELAKARLAELHRNELAAAGVLPAGDQFLPVVVYPLITMYPPAQADTVFHGDEERPDIPFALYVHVPFCASACTYCHWVKMVDPSSEQVEGYLDTIVREMDLAAARLGGGRIPVNSAIFGGGTPTFLSPQQLERLLTALTGRFDFGSCRQFSFEAEPASLCGPLGRQRLEVLKQFGLHRISLGVQSFSDRILQGMGRMHQAADSLQAIEQIRRAGIESLSIDLIYGYPSQTVAEWIESIQTAVAAGVDAWQLYRLRIIRHGDVQGRILQKYQAEPEQFPDPEQVYLMKMIAGLLSEQNGYQQHFTRIFATDNRHVTQFMWDYCCHLTNVIGLGPSAWSNYHRTFTINVGEDFNRYRELVGQGKLPIDRGLYRDRETEARRSFITPLKNDRVYKKRFFHRTGLDLNAHFGPELERMKKLDLVAEDEQTVFLTARGRFFADETVMQFFQKKYLPFPEVAHPLMPE